MTSGDIPNSAITGSSNWDTFIAYNGRLHWTWRGAAQAWISRFNDQNQWLKIDLSTMAFVTAIATQGRHNCACNQWVTSYWFSFSTDGATFLEYKINQARKVKRGIF